jgi:MFS family permease
VSKDSVQAESLRARPPASDAGGVAATVSTAVPVRSVLLAPGVARVFGASLVGRMPAGALGLLLILRTRELGGSFGAGGLAAAAFSLGLAVSAPAIGRAVDARGQTRVLAACAAAVAGALTALALLPGSAPLGAVLVLAVLAGVAHPPLSACQRALWPRLLPDASRQHAAYALEAAALEVTYVLGPLVIVGAVGTRSAALALALCACLLLAGTLTFAAHPASRGWPAAGRLTRGIAGALRSPGVRTLLATQACLGCSFGAIEVGVAAFADHAGDRGATGPVLAAWALASMLGGLAAGRRGAPADPVARLVVLIAAMAAADALLALAPTPLALGLLCIPAGAAIAPLFGLTYVLAGEAAREGTVTEAYTWLATGIAAGLATGSAAGGALAAHHGPAAAFLLAAIAVAAAGAVTRAWSASLRGRSTR